jgi:hypothetical protein
MSLDKIILLRAPKSSSIKAPERFPRSQRISQQKGALLTSSKALKREDTADTSSPTLERSTHATILKNRV